MRGQCASNAGSTLDIPHKSGLSATRPRIRATERYMQGGVGGQIAQGHQRSHIAGDLCECTFPHFTPLLIAAREYARLSGCRFLGRDFQMELAGMSASQQTVFTASREARDAAAPLVKEFTARLKHGDAALEDELRRAFSLIMAESVRSTMVGKCNELNMWPPAAEPVLRENDCDYVDMTASFPVIAQRLFNDEQQRKYRRSQSALNQKKALMASFLTDFASEVGFKAPDMPAEYVEMMSEFTKRADEWEENRAPLENMNSSACDKQSSHCRTGVQERSRLRWLAEGTNLQHLALVLERSDSSFSTFVSSLRSGHMSSGESASSTSSSPRLHSARSSSTQEV